MKCLLSTSTLATNERFVSLKLGESHTCALTSQGNTFCWGANNYSQLGNSAGLPNTPPTAINSSYLRTGERFTRLMSGNYHSCGITDLGNSYCWGKGDFGALGVGFATGSLSLPSYFVDESNL